MRIVDICSSLSLIAVRISPGAKPNGRETQKAEENQQDRSANSSCATVATARRPNSSPVNVVGTSIDSGPSIPPTINSMNSLTQGLNFISGEVIVVT
jgi:hypothetical protein